MSAEEMMYYSIDAITAYEALATCDPDSERYDAAVVRAKELAALREQNKSSAVAPTSPGWTTSQESHRG